MGSKKSARFGPGRSTHPAALTDSEMRDRLVWPAVALLVLLVSCGLWFGAAVALRSLVS
jgi:hypothetical protein